MLTDNIWITGIICSRSHHQSCIYRGCQNPNFFFYLFPAQTSFWVRSCNLYLNDHDTMQEKLALSLSVSLCRPSRPWSCSCGKSWIQDDALSWGFLRAGWTCVWWGHYPTLITEQPIREIIAPAIARDIAQSWTFFNSRNSSRDAIFHRRSRKKS